MNGLTRYNAGYPMACYPMVAQQGDLRESFYNLGFNEIPTVFKLGQLPLNPYAKKAVFLEESVSNALSGLVQATVYQPRSGIKRFCDNFGYDLRGDGYDKLLAERADQGKQMMQLTGMVNAARNIGRFTETIDSMCDSINLAGGDGELKRAKYKQILRNTDGNIMDIAYSMGRVEGGLICDGIDLGAI